MSRILVAAQPSSLREGVRHLLEADHHSVAEARSGGEALASIDRIDLLVCAEGLRDHDAIDLCRYAQERSSEGLPFLLLCRPGSASLPARMQDLESFAILQMPFSARDLQLSADQLIAARRETLSAKQAAPLSEIGSIEGLRRAVTFSPSGRMTVHWGDPMGEAEGSHLRTFVATSEGLLGPPASDEPAALVAESSRRLWVLQELRRGHWLALEIEGRSPLGSARLHARRLAEQLMETRLVQDEDGPG
ncbi:MAG: hypothetical protein AAGK22_09605 [Acidobacteriota bacterium]